MINVGTLLTTIISHTKITFESTFFLISPGGIWIRSLGGYTVYRYHRPIRHEFWGLERVAKNRSSKRNKRASCFSVGFPENPVTVPSRSEKQRVCRVKKSRAPERKGSSSMFAIFRGALVVKLRGVEISKAEKKGVKQKQLPIYDAIYRRIKTLFWTIGRGPPYVSWHVWKGEKIRMDCSTHWKISQHWAKCCAHSNQDENTQTSKHHKKIDHLGCHKIRSHI